MGDWHDILSELKTLNQQEQEQKQRGQGQPKDESIFDQVRRKYLKRLSEKTGRPTILYASQWAQAGGNAETVQILDEDIYGFMCVLRDIPGPSADLVLHLPGGPPQTAEKLVTYLRSRLDDVRVIIPHAAMSAATMMACAANEILMGTHSYIGPVDPQLVMNKDGDTIVSPAKAILDQFDWAQDRIRKDPSELPSWYPILKQYGPSLLKECENACDLSEELVRRWLSAYMFKDHSDPDGDAQHVAQELGRHEQFKLHSRYIARTDAKNLGLHISDLEDDQEVQDLVLSAFHATTHTFAGTPAVKLIESHEGKAMMKLQQRQNVTLNLGPQG